MCDCDYDCTSWDGREARLLCTSTYHPNSVLVATTSDHHTVIGFLHIEPGLLRVYPVDSLPSILDLEYSSGSCAEPLTHHGMVHLPVMDRYRGHQVLATLVWGACVCLRLCSRAVGRLAPLGVALPGQQPGVARGMHGMYGCTLLQHSQGDRVCMVSRYSTGLGVQVGISLCLCACM